MTEQREIVHIAGPSVQSRLLAAALRLSGIRKRQFAPSRFRNATRGPVTPPRALTRQMAVARLQATPWPVFALDPSTGRSGRDILYLHGGAYAAEIVGPQWALAALVAKRTGRRVLVAIYPLAPEHTYHDVLPALADLYDGLSATAPPTLLGDSAGAGLALALAQQLPAERQPDQIVLLSPCVDATLTNPQITDAQRSDPLLLADDLAEIGRWWAGGDDPSVSSVSPLYGDFAGLAPLTVFGGTRDLLTPDALRLRERAIAAGCSVDFYLYEGMYHDWALLPGPESRDVVERLGSLMGASAAAR